MLKVTIQQNDSTYFIEDEKIEFSLDTGECLWLQGVSGAGKSTIALDLVGLYKIPGGTILTEWTDTEVDKQSIGMVFQKGVLVDSLNLEENIALALESADLKASDQQVMSILNQVGLTDQDRYKMPGELSGGMLRRASVAQTIAQKKNVIILDEPFVGLDEENAQEVIKLLKNLMDKGKSFLLISHEPNYAKQVATPEKTVTIRPKKTMAIPAKKRRINHYSFISRTIFKLNDYLGISIPLVLFAFIAAGFAISMLFGDLLKSTDAATIQKHIMSSSEHSLFQSIITFEFNKIAAHYLPLIRQKVFAIGIAKGFMYELGPLLTALLLAGRIGGSYSGEISMMQATSQNQLLQIMGISPRRWSLYPSAIAALIAAPILTYIGILASILAATWVSVFGTSYKLYKTTSEFWTLVKHEIFTYDHLLSYPPFVSLYRSVGFILIILVVAEIIGRMKPHLQPRQVPLCITWSVVIASLCIILTDWGFSQIIVHVSGGF